MKRLTVLAATALFLAWMPSAQAANFTLTQTVVGSGTVASSPAGIACPGDCSESYAAGTVVTLTATADAGSSFDHWTGSVCTGSVSTTCQITMSNTRAITATFSGGGGGTTPVVLILMENTNYSTVDGYGYFGTFAAGGRKFSNYSSIRHPSLPNYFALTAGSTLGCVNDGCPKTQSADNIFNQIPDWRSYEESMVGNCRASNSGEYVARHNPAVYFTDINPSPCNTRDVPYPSSLPSTLAAFTFVTPNLISDMHDGTKAQGSAWLASHVPDYLAKGAIVLIVFDEGSGSNHVWAAEQGPGIPAGVTDSAAYDHYGLLAGLEDFLGVPRLANAVGARALPI